MTDSCAACGKLKSDLPIEIIAQGEEEEDLEVQRFALFDSQWNIYICPDDLDLYGEVQPLASQWPMLQDMPDLAKDILDQAVDLGDRGLALFRKMTI